MVIMDGASAANSFRAVSFVERVVLVVGTILSLMIVAMLEARTLLRAEVKLVRAVLEPFWVPSWQCYLRSS